jgi:hypothetical protein
MLCWKVMTRGDLSRITCYSMANYAGGRIANAVGPYTFFENLNFLKVGEVLNFLADCGE